MNLEPLNERIVVERFDEEETTEGGIIIPDSAYKDPGIDGIVRAVYKGCECVEEGDHVVMRKHVGTEVEVGNKQYLVVAEEDLIGVLR